MRNHHFFGPIAATFQGDPPGVAKLASRSSSTALIVREHESPQCLDLHRCEQSPAETTTSEKALIPAIVPLTNPGRRASSRAIGAQSGLPGFRRVAFSGAD